MPPFLVWIRWFLQGRVSLRPALRRGGRRGNMPCWLKRQESSISLSWSTRWTTPLSTGAWRGELRLMGEKNNQLEYIYIFHIGFVFDSDVLFYTAHKMSGSLFEKAVCICYPFPIYSEWQHFFVTSAGTRSVRRSWFPFWRRWASTRRRTSTLCLAPDSQVPTSRTPYPSALGTRKWTPRMEKLIPFCINKIYLDF